MYPVMGALLISAVAIADVKVTQSPEIIEVIEGGEFQISCTFTASNMISIFGFRWYKQALGHEKYWVMNTSEGFVGRVLQNRGQPSNTDQITVMEANRNDSGIYYCEVELMLIGRGTGMGTRVTVKGREQPDDTGCSLQRQLIAMGVRLAVFAVLIMMTISLVYCCEFRGSPKLLTAEREEATTAGRHPMRRREKMTRVI